MQNESLHQYALKNQKIDNLAYNGTGVSIIGRKLGTSSVISLHLRANFKSWKKITEH